MEMHTLDCVCFCFFDGKGVKSRCNMQKQKECLHILELPHTDEYNT